MRRYAAVVCWAPFVGALAGLGAAPPAHAYDSWCDLVETHSPRIALVSEPLREAPTQRNIDRLNVFYNRVIPQLNTVAFATFWYPDVWGSPDIRPDVHVLLGAMDDLQTTANDGTVTAAGVQRVDDAIGVLHQQCAGKRSLPPLQ
ncbi:hypothetical protein BOO86_21760 [Mycobacterium sp. CBMA 234]|uniref:hypothetical protein n=1 Tax=Mycolicibacterium sp. CBMA 234 TaxID=1918495 RepID=UPI0012DE6DD3|nr:hypothetical protein [Mycolicibacterium sp. CBMA 234]MUL67115.1 hypothetical protein [Mycolicibacterium sp. CBMA 234]